MYVYVYFSIKQTKYVRQTQKSLLFQPSYTIQLLVPLSLPLPHL